MPARFGRFFATVPATPAGGRFLSFLAAVVITAGVALGGPREAALSAILPQIGDHTALSWREGAPYVTNYRPEDASEAAYSSARRFLRLATGHFAADVDTEKIALTGFLRRPAPVGEVEVVTELLEATPLPPARLEIVIRVGDLDFHCAGRKALPLNARGQPDSSADFPVRIIESGRFFQKFALHDLEFRASAGERLPVDARLEVSAWPDRLVLLLVVRPSEPLGSARARLSMRMEGQSLESETREVHPWAAASEQRTLLSWGGGAPSRALPRPEDIVVHITPDDPRGKATVAWNAEEVAPTLRIEAPPWPKPEEGGYPERMLDAWESYAVTVENRSGEPQSIGLNFDHLPAKAIIGYVPMVLDDARRPSGLPVQVSKNWHVAKSGAPLPHMGPWMHGRTWLGLPGNSRVSFRYGITFARWGGVPTASLAQLSLVGWGHNGFWDQLALGSFGESICLQPGRVMRRALLTDFRPLFQRGYAKDERWAWTGNVGGGDTMVRLDPAGRYVPFRRNVARYASYGPNLAQVTYDEVSDDDAIRSRTEVFLPRTDDGLRVYLRVRHEVTRRVEFSRLALFQLGADFYNEADATLLASGDVGGLAAELRRDLIPPARLPPAWAARGEQPWLSLHGETRADGSRVGQASRGLIVREWRATLGGRNIPSPFFRAGRSPGAKAHLAAEIVPPPALATLEAGDHVEMLLELLLIPLAAERYYGPDPKFAAGLAAGANTWRPVHREASGNRPVVRLPDGSTIQSWPLSLRGSGTREESFSIEGGLGWIPVRITGLPAADAVDLFRLTATGREPVIQGDSERAFWQCDYDPVVRRWSVTYNLPAVEHPVAYLLVPREGSSGRVRPWPRVDAERVEKR